MKNEEFREKAHTVLDEVINHINEMEKKAGEVTEDLKHDYNQKLGRLKEIKNDLTAKLADFEVVSESRWDVVKDSFSEFLENVSVAWKESFDKTKSAFK